MFVCHKHGSNCHLESSFFWYSNRLLLSYTIPFTLRTRRKQITGGIELSTYQLPVSLMIQILSFFASGDNCKRWPLWTGLVHHSWRPCSPRLWWLAVGCCCQLRRDNRSIIINVAWPSRTFKIIPWKNIYEKPDPHHYTTLNLYFCLKFTKSYE